MPRLYNLHVYHKQDIQEGFEEDYYPCITEGILDAVKTKHEGAYDRGEYVALRFEYEIIQ